MSVNQYVKGNVIHLTVAFTQQLTGGPIDPLNVNLLVLDPNGAQSSFSFPGTITRDSQGNFHLDFSGTTVVGDYAWRWVGTGVGQAATEGVFNIQPSRF